MYKLPDGLKDITFNSNGECTIREKFIVSSTDIENRLKTIKYTGEHRNSNNIVEGAHLPPFVVPFYLYVRSKKTIPDEREFIYIYFKKYIDVLGETCKVKNEYLKDYSFSGIVPVADLEARILRAYPSLIREFHFFVLCVESQSFTKCVYSLKVDLIDGYDLMVDYSGRTFRIKLYLNTENGRMYLEKKLKRHSPDIDPKLIIALGHDLGHNKIGDFSLYGKDNVTELLHKLNERIETSGFVEQKVAV